jgi:UDP-N-acetylglucosamine 3-dehydrogenase
MSNIKKTGIAGLGHIGRRHLAQYKALGLSVVTADPKVDAAEAKALGADAHYRNFVDMLLAEKPQAVSICLPSFMHRDNAIIAMEYGADVLVEKPLALELQDIDDMIVAARAFGRRVMVGHVCRFMGQYIMAKEMIDGGTLGKPVYLNAWRESATPMWTDKNWLGNPAASGGSVMDLQIHEIDLACWFLGPVQGAAMIQRQNQATEGSGFCHAISNLSFSNGAAAVLEAGHLMPEGYPASSGYRLVFEQGVMEFSLSGKETSMHLYEKATATDLTQQFKDRFGNRYAFFDEIKHFVDCLNTGEEFIVTAEDGRRAVEAVLKLTQSEILT